MINTRTKISQITPSFDFFDVFALFHSFIDVSVLINGQHSSDSKFPIIKLLFRSELISFLPVDSVTTRVGLGSLTSSWFSKLEPGTICEMLNESWFAELTNCVHDDFCRHEPPLAAAGIVSPASFSGEPSL